MSWHFDTATRTEQAVPFYLRSELGLLGKHSTEKMCAPGLSDEGGRGGATTPPKHNDRLAGSHYNSGAS